MEWISVKDRQPEPHEDVVIKLVDKSEYKAFKGEWTDVYYCLDIDEWTHAYSVTHWQPLPPNPKD